MKTLDQIALCCGTDKASKHPHLGHDYARHYDATFQSLRMEPIKILEIGVGGGESIQMWLEYFSKAKVYGVDNVRDTNQWNTPGTTGRYTSISGDQSDEVFWKCFLVDYGRDWNVIVDDGGHYVHQIVTTFKSMWPHIVPGGFYAIEDLAVSYGSIFIPDGWESHMKFIAQKMDEINLGDEIESLTFSKELAIFKKKPLQASQTGVMAS